MARSHQRFVSFQRCIFFFKGFVGFSCAVPLKCQTIDYVLEVSPLWKEKKREHSKCILSLQSISFLLLFIACFISQHFAAFSNTLDHSGKPMNEPCSPFIPLVVNTIFRSTINCSSVVIGIYLNG